MTPMKLRENASYTIITGSTAVRTRERNPRNALTLFPEHEIPGDDDGIDSCSTSWVSFLYMKKRLDGQ